MAGNGAVRQDKAVSGADRRCRRGTPSMGLGMTRSGMEWFGNAGAASIGTDASVAARARPGAARQAGLGVTRIGEVRIGKGMQAGIDKVRLARDWQGQARIGIAMQATLGPESIGWARSSRAKAG